MPQNACRTPTISLFGLNINIFSISLYALDLSGPLQHIYLKLTYCEYLQCFTV